MTFLRLFKSLSLLFVLSAGLLVVACNQEMPASSGEKADTEAVPGLYAFVNVNVLPMDRERVVEGQTVVVRDGRIASIEPAGGDLPAGATLIDGTGHYLMPGLAEMHGHIPGAEDPQYVEDVLFLYVSNGVTLVRGMAGDPSHLPLREKTASGGLIGPTIFAAGPWLGTQNAATAEQTRATVIDHAKQGFDLLKVGNLPAEHYPLMAAVAREQGIPFAGHIPPGVTLEQVFQAGQASIDHLDRYVEFLIPEGTDPGGRESGFFGSGLIDLVDTGRIPAAVTETVAAGVWNVPTLSLVEHLASPEPATSMAQWPEMRYLPSSVVEGWVRSKRYFMGRIDFRPEATRQLIALRRTLLKALHDGGARIVLGSDAPQFFNVPGFSIHHEMRMMVEAGLTPYEVLVTGTRNAAAYFGTPDDFGQVAVGHRADLILLESNPFLDIAHVQDRAGVMVRGRWIPEAEIQQRLAAIAKP